MYWYYIHACWGLDIFTCPKQPDLSSLPSESVNLCHISGLLPVFLSSSRLIFNTLNKNTTVKTGNFSRGCWAFCSLHFAAEKNLRLSFPHRRKELCLLVKKVFDESHRQLSEERRRCCRWNPTPAGWSRTIWTLGDWADGWWSVSDPIICTVHTHTHTGKCFHDGV